MWLQWFIGHEVMILWNIVWELIYVSDQTKERCYVTKSTTPTFYNISRNGLCKLFKDKLRHNNIFEFIWANTDSKWAAPDQRWWGVLHWLDLGRGSYREEGEAKRGNCLAGYRISCCLIWESLVGCLRLVVLKFDFLGFFNIEFGLGFGLFM